MASVNVCMMCGSDPVNGECPECGGVRPLVTRAARADMILPRDCDGGLVDLAAEAAGFHPDERIGIADQQGSEWGRIARDLDNMADRIRALNVPGGHMWKFWAHHTGILAAMSDTAANM